MTPKTLEEFIEKYLEVHKEYPHYTELAAEILRVAEEWCNEVYTKDSSGVFMGLKQDTRVARDLLDFLKSYIQPVKKEGDE